MLCQALCRSIREEEWTEIHDKVKRVSEKIGVTQEDWSDVSRSESGWVRKVGMEKKMLREAFFSAKEERMQGRCAQIFSQFGELTFTRPAG